MPFGKNVVKSNNEDMHKHSDDIGNNNVENVMLTVWNPNILYEPNIKWNPIILYEPIPKWNPKTISNRAPYEIQNYYVLKPRVYYGPYFDWNPAT